MWNTIPPFLHETLHESFWNKACCVGQLIRDYSRWSRQFILCHQTIVVHWLWAYSIAVFQCDTAVLIAVTGDRRNVSVTPSGAWRPGARRFSPMWFMTSSLWLGHTLLFEVVFQKCVPELAWKFPNSVSKLAFHSWWLLVPNNNLLYVAYRVFESLERSLDSTWFPPSHDSWLTRLVWWDLDRTWLMLHETE